MLRKDMELLEKFFPGYFDQALFRIDAEFFPRLPIKHGWKGNQDKFEDKFFFSSNFSLFGKFILPKKAIARMEPQS